MTIESEKKNFGVAFDICYWRKYWGLRDKILKVLENVGGEEYSKNINLNELENIQKILIEYCDINNVNKEHLSTIWTPTEEVYHMRQQACQLQIVLDCIYQKISLEDLIGRVLLWQDIEIKEEKIQKLKEILASPPDDLTITFEFYDSY